LVEGATGYWPGCCYVLNFATLLIDLMATFAIHVWMETAARVNICGAKSSCGPTHVSN